MSPRVLVVEDDEKSRRLLADVLGHHGYAVWAAPTGEEALRMLAAGLPEAALLDIQLPGISGFDVLRALRAIPGGLAVPAFAVTASAMDSDRRRILSAGFDACVAKPVNIRQLLHSLQAMLGSRIA